MNIPGSRTDDSISSILPLDSAEFEVDELGDVADERKDLADAVVDQCDSRQEVHQRA